MSQETRFPIRPASPDDAAAIRAVVAAAFQGDSEAKLVERLRDEGYARCELVALDEGRIVGHVMLSAMQIETEQGAIEALALAPLAVLPERQRQGIGAALVREGLALCRRDGHKIAIVLGHPHYYPRFGFAARLAESLKSPFDAGEAWMAIELAPGALDGVSGKARYPPPFGID